MRYAWIISLLCILFTAPLCAETFVLADGTTVEGTVLEENGTEIVVQAKYGKITLKRSDIAKTLKQDGARERLKTKWSTLEEGPRKSEAAAWVELGQEAQKAGVKDYFRAAMRQALKLEPTNAAAQQALDSEAKEAAGGAPVAAQERKAPKPPERVPQAGQPSDALTPLTQKVEAHDCPTCGGYGILKNLPGQFKGFPCMTCAGKGKLDKVVTYDGVEVPKGYHLCTLCDGKKFGTWKFCDKCSKSEMPGLVKRMSGYYICESCKGMGEIPGLPCRECKGVGFMKDK